jgi:lantibiotic biosynthesis protein
MVEVARPAAARRIDSPGFCHGVAGLLQTTLRFAHDTALESFRAGARSLVRQLLDAYEPNAPLGYRSVEPGGERVDRPGLLEGAPAVAMVLLAAATAEPPGWDRLFALS